MNTPFSSLPSVPRNQTIKQLQQFYQKPIAKVSTELIATLLAVILLALFAIRPTLLTMSQLLHDIEDRRKTSDALSKKIASLSTLSSELPTLKNEVGLLHRAIPNTPNFDGFMRRLEYVATAHTVLINSLQVTQVPKEATSTAPQLTSYLISVNLKAPYPLVRTFIAEMLAMDRFVSIDSLVMNAKRDEFEKTSSLITTVAFRVAYYGTPIQLPGSSAKKDEKTP